MLQFQFFVKNTFALSALSLALKTHSQGLSLLS